MNYPYKESMMHMQNLKPNRQVLADRAQHSQATKNARMIKSNATMISTAIEKWLDRIAFWKANTAKKRFLKQRKVRRAAHLARKDRDQVYKARSEKLLRDYIYCRMDSCHNVSWM